MLTLGHYERSDTIRLKNNDGSLWYKFTFYYDDSDGRWDYPNDEFRPRAFHPDNFTLALDVVDDHGTEYTVVVNQKNGLRKRIAKEHFLQFLTWEQYVLKAFSVGFNERENPIRTTPAGDSTIAPPTEDPTHPVRIEGEWLQIRWGREGNWRSGWIRWRRADKLLVVIHSFA